MTLALSTLLLTSACSVIYDSQRELARKSCHELATLQERNECLKRQDTNYSQYEKQRQDVQENGTEKKAAPKKDNSLCFKRESTGELVCPN